jgi:hypothetical protein
VIEFSFPLIGFVEAQYVVAREILTGNESGVTVAILEIMGWL